ncbi:MAG TPA: hypothetical protein VN728_02630 [Stellaceae bacterium]|jgi:hypothetical protein|nr:hypothetical protein [Stellaceae bacterium]
MPASIQIAFGGLKRLALPFAVSVILFGGLQGETASAASGDQIIHGTWVHTDVDEGRGIATFSNACGSQTLTQTQLQRGAIPENIIPCPRPETLRGAEIWPRVRALNDQAVTAASQDDFATAARLENQAADLLHQIPDAGEEAKARQLAATLAQRAAADAAKRAPAVPLRACVQPGEATPSQCTDDPAGTKDCKCLRFSNLCSVPVSVHYSMRPRNGRPITGNLPLEGAGRGQSRSEVCTTSHGETLTYTGWEQRTH